MKYIFLFILIFTFGNSYKARANDPCASALEKLFSTGHRFVEGEGEKGRWLIDGPSDAREKYASSFFEIIQKTEEGALEPYFFFDHYLSERRKQGLSTNILDLFGSGFFIKKHDSVDSITGFRFGSYSPIHDPSLQAIGEVWEEAPKTPEVLGDIFNPSTWIKLDDSMRNRHIKSMDLVTMKPEGAWTESIYPYSEEKVALALIYILENVIKRLSEDGRFYFKIHSNSEIINNSLLRAFIDKSPNRKLVFSTDTNEQLSGALLPR